MLLAVERAINQNCKRTLRLSAYSFIPRKTLWVEMVVVDPGTALTEYSQEKKISLNGLMLLQNQVSHDWQTCSL